MRFQNDATISFVRLRIYCLLSWIMWTRWTYQCSFGIWLIETNTEVFSACPIWASFITATWQPNQAKSVQQSYDNPQHGGNIHLRKRLNQPLTWTTGKYSLCGIWREILDSQIPHGSLPNDHNNAKRTQIQTRRPTGHGKKISHLFFQESGKS